MKKVFYLLISVILMSCTGELETIPVNGEPIGEVVDVQRVKVENTAQTKASSSDTYILKFRDRATFDRLVAQLSSGTKENAEAWENSLGFVSLNTIFENAMREAETLDESEQAYKAFKAKYGESLYFPEYKEDYGAYLPVSNQQLAFVLNKNGEVLIGDEKVNFKDVTEYYQLQLTGEALYEADENTPSFFLLTEKQYVGKQYDSGWRVNPDGDRKLKLKIGRRIYDVNPSTHYFTVKLHFEISFRKKTWLGWSNYSSYTKTTATYYVHGRRMDFTQEEENKSSHDHYVTNSHDCPELQISQGNGEFATTRINGTVNIQFRGFPSIAVFNFDMPGGDLYTKM